MQPIANQSQTHRPFDEGAGVWPVEARTSQEWRCSVRRRMRGLVENGKPTAPQVGAEVCPVQSGVAWRSWARSGTVRHGTANPLRFQRERRSLPGTSRKGWVRSGAEMRNKDWLCVSRQSWAGRCRARQTHRPTSGGGSLRGKSRLGTAWPVWVGRGLARQIMAQNSSDILRQVKSSIARLGRARQTHWGTRGPSSLPGGVGPCRSRSVRQCVAWSGEATTCPV